jgi:hypothetical protein
LPVAAASARRCGCGQTQRRNSDADKLTAAIAGTAAIHLRSITIGAGFFVIGTNRRMAGSPSISVDAPAARNARSRRPSLRSRMDHHPRREDNMAFPTAVNDQITDSVTQANVKVLGDAPAIAMGNLYQATAQALANAAHNATNAQQQSYVTAQAATTMGVATLYSLDTASTGVATKDILSTGVKGLGSP